MKTKKVQIKGIKDGLLVETGSGDWAEEEKALLKHIKEQGDFYQGGRLAIDVGNHVLKAAKLGALRDILSDHGVKLWAVLSNSPTTEQAAQALGLTIRLKQPMPPKGIPEKRNGIQGENALFYRRTLRSGHKVKYPGHVIVLGDVNPGAEIIAGGNIIVWGRFRGLAHAGAQGDTEAVVCALELSPTQLRIADKISISPPARKDPEPEIAYLENGQVVAQPWKAFG